MELGCRADVQTGEKVDANSVHQFGDKHSFRYLLAISYKVVTVTRH